MSDIEITMTVLDEVLTERTRQDERWGEQNHHPTHYLTVLGEEYGESCQACCHAMGEIGGKKTWQDYREELVQVAAVAVAMIECFDRGKDGRNGE